MTVSATGLGRMGLRNRGRNGEIRSPPFRRCATAGGHFSPCANGTVLEENSRRRSAHRRCAASFSCCWPKAQNAGVSGAAPLGVFICLPCGSHEYPPRTRPHGGSLVADGRSRFVARLPVLSPPVSPTLPRGLPSLDERRFGQESPRHTSENIQFTRRQEGNEAGSTPETRVRPRYVPASPRLSAS